MEILAKGSFGALLLTTAMGVAAFPVDVASINGTFENTKDQYGNKVTGDGLNVISWGDNGTESSYGFNGASPLPIEVNDSSEFSLGTLTHTNNQVSGPTLKSTDLAITLGFSGFGDTGTQEGKFEFSHNETPDVGANWECVLWVFCWDKKNGAIDDTITQTGSTVTSSSFTLGGFDYTLELLGLKANGSTAEHTTRDYNLWAKLNATGQPVPVPEPGTLALLGLGLAGLGMARRRKA